MVTLSDLVIAMSPCGALEPSPRTAIAGRRGGGLGVLDLGAGGAAALRALSQAVSWSSDPMGVRVPAGCLATINDVRRAGAGRLDLIVLTAGAPWSIADAAEGHRALVEVTSRAEARVAAATGAHGLIARGTESGGRAGGLSTFVLLQHLLDDDLGLPVWAAGGIGPRTAVACVMGGAAGVLLDSQLGLMPESDLTDQVIQVLRRMDGTEAVTVEGQRGIPVAARHRDAGPPNGLWPIGEDGHLAAMFADRWPDTAAAVRGVRTSIADALADRAAADSLVPGAPLAASLGIGIPVAQGPMTRVTDQPAFAAAVATSGALPFIALALYDGNRSAAILRETAAALAGHRWGVGILGFVPDELRTAQLDAIRQVRPDFAIIAGGRPAQARALERDGVATFLHVPSPGLLRQFLRAGARRFVFEGSECGGHVGPRSSFDLWEAQCAVLAEHLDHAPADEAARLQVFFAGGIHDARSAAMVAALAGDLTRRGVEIGVLMGTAYLFTEEAVAHGAIQPLFQRKALAAAETALLETAPGHVTRCLISDYVEEFRRRRDVLNDSGVDRREVWERLELLNTGRLRLASRGRAHDGAVVDEAGQSAEGLYMAGQVAVLRSSPTTVAALHHEVSVGAARLLAERVDGWSDRRETIDPRPVPRDVAIIGMACAFPGSPDLAGFWRMILGAQDAITEVPVERWDQAAYYTSDVDATVGNERVISRWGGFLDRAEFDPIRFGIPPAALGSIDPSQLLGLDMADRTLVDAGYRHDALDADHSRTGVVFGAQFGGDVTNGTMIRSMLPGFFGEVPREFDEQLPAITEDTFPGILPNVIAGRIANRLNLGGVNFTVDAACAASLAAVDVACKELTTGAADLMLCGGVDLHNGICEFIMFGSVRALSATGRARTFDQSADGTALGEGVACVALKRLADAQRDGDRIYAVIKGVGSASDGRSLGLTAPSPTGQLSALRRAYREAGVSPRSVALVEAHGTGTIVGDRTELQSLTAMFGGSEVEPGGCVLGSVKSQIGHTKSAAGLAGLIKAAMAVYTGVQPPTLHLTRPNSAWDPADSPFSFLTRPRPWLAQAAERVAGVSAFGFGGTNFHVILSGHSQTPEPRHASTEWPAELFVFRGTDREAAVAAVRGLHGALARGDGRPAPRRLRELAAENARDAGTRIGPVRIAIVARDLDELGALAGRALAGEHDPAAGLIQPSHPPDDAPPAVAFLFPGQGSQRPGALAELFVHFPELRQFLRDSQPVAARLFPTAAFDAAGRRVQSDRLRETSTAQPALGIAGLAAHHLLGRLGIRPDLVAGHSYGELVALCVAGSFDPATLLSLSAERADAMLAAAGADPGTMAAVAGTPDQVSAVLAAAGLLADVVLANHNAPAQVVISGPTAEVGAATGALDDAGLSVRRLAVACAFHSPLMATSGARFATALDRHTVSAPDLPVWANRTAGVYPTDPDLVRDELAAQIGAPVRFAEQIENMYAGGARVFVEVGPGHILTSLVGAILGSRPHLAVACDSPKDDGLRGFLITVGQLGCAGVPVNLGWLHHGRTDIATPTVTDQRPRWLVDGQLVRDSDGTPVAGGLTPTRPIKESLMPPLSAAPRGVGPTDRETLLADYLRLTGEMITAQRDVMLAYLGETAPTPAVRQHRPVEPAVAPQLVAQPVTEIAVPAPAAAVPAVPGPTIVDIRAAVLGLISEKTGYPVELIGIDLDLEADLGIDSIKRAELGGDLGAALGILADGDESDLEDIIRARSVRAIETWLQGRLSAGTGAAGPPAPGSAEIGPAVEHGTAAANGQAAAQFAGRRPARLIQATVRSDVAVRPASLVTGAQFVVSGAPPVADALAGLLRGHGARVRTAADATATGDLDGVDGLILLDGLGPAGTAEPAAMFPTVKAALGRGEAVGGPRWLFAAGDRDGPRTAGLAGLFRTAHREYPHIDVRYIECEAGAVTAPEQLARRILGELLDGQGAPAVTYRDGIRHVFEVVPAELGAVAQAGAGPDGGGAAEARAIGLDRDSVVILVGGARGIGAWTARALAAAGGCRIELAGRTTLPATPESLDTAAATDLAGLRAVLARQAVGAPPEIDRRAREIVAVREVRATVAELTELGSQVRYHPVDVRDDDAVRQLVKTVHDEYGRVDGVVYAAGVVEDRLIAQKDPESFARVFTTKVAGAQSLLAALTDQGCAPRFVVLFGSVSAGFGTAGQVDYAAANDALDRIGTVWAAGTGHRCLTVHWGPWAPVGEHPGMVTPEIGRQYAKRGIAMIDPEEGALSLLRELAWGERSVTSVVYTATGPDAHAPAAGGVTEAS